MSAQLDLTLTMKATWLERFVPKYRPVVRQEGAKKKIKKIFKTIFLFEI